MANLYRFRKSGYRFKTMRVLEFSIESRRRKSVDVRINAIIKNVRLSFSLPHFLRAFTLNL